MGFLDELNPQQREAVTTTEGPVLILAGAGSGKTRAITYRIAHLVSQGHPPHSILAVTFTNKAADQMKERVAALLARQGLNAAGVWLSTFHSFCVRMLRSEAGRLGLRRDFAIYDEEDQAAAVKLALRDLRLDESQFTPRQLLSRISSCKNHGITSEALRSEVATPPERQFSEIFDRYEARLKSAGALDFDDLLLRGVELLDSHAQARETWQQRFRYIHVDEYQDTNPIQYRLLRLLTGPARNLCVVGDEDQSIYGWRGADVGNILRFAEDFPGARVIRLEQNYRSTQEILDAAGAVVSHNQRRIGKTLLATRGAGTLLNYFEAPDANAEAEYVAEQVSGLHRADPSQSIAVLYRTNAQSRALEEAMRRRSLRYRLLGGFSFYLRAEVKDALAYLRLCFHPQDDVALLRIINTPPRGIGKTTVDALREHARLHSCSLWDAIPSVMLAGRAAAPLARFRELIDHLDAERETRMASEFLTYLLDRTGYLDTLEQQDSVEGSSRADNLRELVNALAEAEEQEESLLEFLDHAALVSDADNYDERSPITLMTLHTAKGLEFEHVFVAGMEEGLFPHSRSRNSPDELEEERRLCYVGMTRAKDSLTLTSAAYRRNFGAESLQISEPSRFLSEIPAALIETEEGSLADAGNTRRYVPDPEFAGVERFRRFRGRPAPPAETKTSRSSRATSGADSSRPRRQGSARAQSHPLIGVRVRHKTYGVGTIIGVDGDDDDRRLTVSFSGHGAKKLVERFAHLERV